MNAVARFITGRPLWVIAATLAVTAFWLTRIVDFSSSPPRLLLEIDPSINRLLPGADESRRFWDQTRKVFGNDDMLVVAVQSEELFTPRVLRQLKRMHDEIGDIEGVERVVSLFSALDIYGEADSLMIRPFLEGVPEDSSTLEEIRERVLGNPVYAGNLVSRDGQATAFVVYLENRTDSELIRIGLDENLDVVTHRVGDDIEVWVSGAPHVKLATSRVLVADLSRVIPLQSLFLAVVAFIAFRSGRGVAVPLLGIGIAVIWLLGTMATFDIPLSLITIVVPAMVQTVGFAYTIHVVSEYYDHLRVHGTEVSADGMNPAGHALRDLALPLGLTAFTTGVGLASLMVSPLTAVREFGLLSVCGIGYTMLIAGTFTPAALSLGAASLPRALHANDGFDRLATRVGLFVVRHRPAILAGSAVLFLVAVIGVPRIRISTDFVSNFAPDHPVRTDFEAIARNLDGADSFSVVLEVEEREAFKERENLREVERLQEWLDDQPEVGSTTSLADYIRLINWGFQGNDPEQMRIPESRRLISQLLFFGGNDELPKYVDSTYASTRIVVRFVTVDSEGLSQLLDRLEVRLAELPEHMVGRATGGTALLARSVDGISLGQVRSISLAFAVIYLLLSAFFRSLRIGLLALIPNALPVAFYFGLLGYSGVTLNATTALIACMALGIAVDDTIHYFARFRVEARRLPDDRAAVAALQSVGRPVTVTTIGLCLGFLALTGAELRNQAEFGALTAATLAFAWLTDILVSPAVAIGSGMAGRPEAKPSP